MTAHHVEIWVHLCRGYIIHLLCPGSHFILSIRDFSSDLCCWSGLCSMSQTKYRIKQLECHHSLFCALPTREKWQRQKVNRKSKKRKLKEFCYSWGFFHSKTFFFVFFSTILYCSIAYSQEIFTLGHYHQ